MSLSPTIRAMCVCLLLGFATPAWASDIGHEVAEQVNLASYQHYLDDLLYTHNGNNRNALTGPDKGPARDNIVATLESFGLDVELEPFTYQGTTCYNVIATQLGTVHPEAYFVIGAHYDSASNPGADDNASGVAGVLEIARILSAYESEYTIKYMAFDAEEYGLIGSNRYVNAHLYDDIRGMISMDMIAWNTASNKAEVYGFAACAAIKNALNSAIVEYGQGLTAQLFTESYSGSDHGPFQNAGFQACLLIEDNPEDNPCYHTSCDSVDNAGYINYAYALKMTRSVAGYLVDNASVFHPIDCQTGEGCDLTTSHNQDCNANGVWDHCDVRCGTSEDMNLNRVPDECEPHETWYVNCANCPGPSSGSEADPFCTIQAAINAAANGVGTVVEIIVADGVYTGTGNKDLDFGGKLITLRSASGPANCAIDCQASGRGFYFHGAETAAARVDGFTIRNGSVDSSSPGGAYGGGVYCNSSSSPTLTNCSISANTITGSSVYGGGLYCYYSSPMLTNCIITNNVGTGVYCAASSEPTLIDCTISGNTTNGSGGGLSCSSSSPVLTNCTISGNTTNGSGGGLYCSSSSPVLTNCTISGNTTNGSGGGLYCYHSNPVLTDCTISGNKANGPGGGLDCSSSSPVLTNCSISANTNAHYGGGLYCSSSSPVLTNCTISGNTTKGCGGGLGCYSSNPTLVNCTISHNTTSGASPYGGGVHCQYSSPALTNCSIIANTTTGHGGGLYCSSSSPALTNCSIIANTTTGSSGHGGGLHCSSSNPTLVNCTMSGNVVAGGSALGGGVYCAGASSSPSLTNCILWGDMPQEIYVHSGTPVVTYSDIQGGWTGTGNLNTNPLFVDAVNGDFHLASNSPCIDAGDPSSDYSLEPEPDGGRINMGAYGNTPEAESKGWLYIQGYSLVEKVRVGRTLWDYRLSVRVENESATDATAVSLELLHMPSNVSIIDGQVDVGSVAAGATVTSADTFTIRVDRRTLISELGISWRVTYALGGVREERTFAGSLGRETLEPSHLPAVPEPLPPQETAGGASRPANAATKPG